MPQRLTIPELKICVSQLRTHRNRVNALVHMAALKNVIVDLKTLFAIQSATAMVNATSIVDQMNAISMEY